jgi:hypothetical protein
VASLAVIVYVGAEEPIAKVLDRWIDAVPKQPGRQGKFEVIKEGGTVRE